MRLLSGEQDKKLKLLIQAVDGDSALVGRMLAQLGDAESAGVTEGRLADRVLLVNAASGRFDRLPSGLRRLVAGNQVLQERVQGLAKQLIAQQRRHVNGTAVAEPVTAE